MKETGSNHVIIPPTDNVSETDNSNNVSESSSNASSKVSECHKYWRKYNNVTLHLDPRVWRVMKKMAGKEDCTVSSVVNEALMSWVKWIYQVQVEEGLVEEKERIEGELREAEDLIASIKQERKDARYKEKRRLERKRNKRRQVARERREAKIAQKTLITYQQPETIA